VPGKRMLTYFTCSQVLPDDDQPGTRLSRKATQCV
jgi:hypothetical protein